MNRDCGPLDRDVFHASDYFINGDEKLPEEECGQCFDEPGGKIITVIDFRSGSRTKLTTLQLCKECLLTFIYKLIIDSPEITIEDIVNRIALMDGPDIFKKLQDLIDNRSSGT